ncbi:hypothetical protein L227DRAFT_606409 [Lentinus tigrinus ALCF2SS1-6]|uniref:MARVEL domain-containing protein n=1 Tax=Lentinus tigrinus ALCF2SS1-6 TaxID=1328759 RepID=A0A5C2SR07_9APHY|nr:hypothetical protein L227DRAFT_606409 [Lentinus tigrinus ALCF2SS1-6]
MAVSLSFYRYASFGLFTLCNAVICCISMWNLVLAQQIGWDPLVDAYLIALSALGIIFIFPILCIDLLRKNALVSRVWFEAVWVGLFWIAQLAGAAAATAILPNMLCNFAADLLIPGSCSTTKVILAFTWINTVNLLAYFLLLMISSIIHMKDDSTVWGANTRTYPWFRVREPLHSAQPSPVRTTWSKAPLPSAAPKIRLTSDFGDRMVQKSGAPKSANLRSAVMKSAAMKSSAFRSSRYEKENEKENAMLSAVPNSALPRSASKSANKSAKILQSAWISATVTPASPPSDDSYGSSDSGSGSQSDRSDLTSTPTGLPPSAMYVPFSSTIKPSPLGTAPPRSSSLATFNAANGQPPLSAVLTPSRTGSLRSAVPSPKPPAAITTGQRKSKRKSTRPPPLDMTRLHSTYGR